jgi:hypothetical protein
MVEVIYLMRLDLHMLLKVLTRWQNTVKFFHDFILAPPGKCWDCIKIYHSRFILYHSQIITVIEVFHSVLNYIFIYYAVPKGCIFRKTSYILSCISDRVWIDDWIKWTLITCNYR